MAMSRVSCESTAVGFGLGNGLGGPPPQNQNPSAAPKHLPLLSIPKPSWIVKTESNIRKVKRKNPDPPCITCRGTGTTECHECHGKGRTNYVHLEILPKGEWPHWCRECRGSGLSYCSHCLGTGEYRNILGFQFMGRDADTKDAKGRFDHKGSRRSSADSLINNE